MNSSLVSVIVPAYNEETRISACLDSVCSQTYANIEILCINDGSTDATLSIMQDYAKKDSRISIIDQENQGLGMSRNNALALCKGDFIVGIDADDVFLPNMIENALSCMDDDIDIVCFNTKLEHDGNDEAFMQQKAAYYCNKFEGKVAVNENCITKTSSNFWNKLWRAALIRDYDVRFGTVLYEDNVFFSCAVVHARYIYYLNEELYIHRLRQNSIMDRTYQRASLMPLDLMVCVEKIYAHLKRYDLLDTWKSLFLHIFKTQFNCLRNWLPADCSSMAISVANYVARKIKLTELHPDNAEILQMLSLSNLHKAEYLASNRKIFEEQISRTEKKIRTDISALSAGISDAMKLLGKFEDQQKEQRKEIRSLGQGLSALGEGLSAIAKDQVDCYQKLESEIRACESLVSDFNATFLERESEINSSYGRIADRLDGIANLIRENGIQMEREQKNREQEFSLLKQSLQQNEKRINDAAQKRHYESLLLQQGLLIRCRYYYYCVATICSWGKRKAKHIQKRQKLQGLHRAALEVRKRYFKY